MTLKQIRCIPK